MDAFVARGCTEVTGTLSIVGTDLTSVNLLALTMAKSLEISGNTVLASVSLPALAIVPSNRYWPLMRGFRGGGLAITGNAALATVSLPALASIGAGEISGNPALGSLDMPMLAAILEPYSGSNSGQSGGLRISILSPCSISLPALRTGTLGAEGSGLTSLSLPVLANGSVGVSGTALASLDLPLLATGIVWVSATALTTLDLPVLKSGEALGVDSNPFLARVSAPALKTLVNPYGNGQLYVSGNSALTSLSLPVLASAQLVTITGNTSYPQCAAEAILAHLVNFTGTATITGNDTAATCPP
jgi:hypothetical protein